jgi:hypothetical protein
LLGSVRRRVLNHPHLQPLLHVQQGCWRRVRRQR